MLQEANAAKRREVCVIKKEAEAAGFEVIDNIEPHQHPYGFKVRTPSGKILSIHGSLLTELDLGPYPPVWCVDDPDSKDAPPVDLDNPEQLGLTVDQTDFLRWSSIWEALIMSFWHPESGHVLPPLETIEEFIAYLKRRVSQGPKSAGKQ
jgi:hypothetical protein